jgi:hypothetical protein
VALRQVASLNNGAVVLYEDVTLDRQGNVVERHGFTLDCSKAADGDDAWFEVSGVDGRKLAEAAVRTKGEAIRQMAVADRKPEAIAGVTLSWEGTRADVKDARSL